MNLDRNNNRQIIFRVAKSNLLGKKLSSFFSILSIVLAITLISVLALFVTGAKISTGRMLDKMQHTMFMNIQEEQMIQAAADDRTELMIPYKYNEKEFGTEGIEYSFYYFESRPDKVMSYAPVEGRAPEKYDEIVIDKGFMNALGKECEPGAEITLDMDGEKQTFIVTGYTDDHYSVTTHPIKVSKPFAEDSPIMKNIPYTALLRIKDAKDMSVSSFETVVYQMAADYGVERASVNMNGKFEESLQEGNVGMYTILLVSVLIAAAGGLVIYSIFYLSVASRMQQVGQLQTIGMTQKQVRKMIRTEGFLLSLLAIPAGLLLSGMIVYFIQPDGWDFANYGMISLFAAVFGLIVVQISVGKPASAAAKVSPIEASRSFGFGEDTGKDRKHGKLSAATLARMEVGKNRKKWWLTTASLAFGGIVFMAAASYLAAWNEEAYSRQEMFEESEYYISYLYDHSSPRPYGITDMQITGHLNEEMKERLMQIPHVTGIHVENSATAILEYQGATFTQSFYPLTEDSHEYFEVDAEGNNSYEYMEEQDGILITEKDLIETINGITFKPGDKVTLRWFDGQEHTKEVEIAAVTSERAGKSELNRPNFSMTDKTMKKMWPSMNTIASFSVSVEDYETYGDEVERQISSILEKYEDLSLLTLREKKLEDAGQVKNLKIQIYGLSAFVMIFSIFNMINTIISGIANRKKELSMLESIGMEETQIRKMLLWENLFLALPNIGITLAGGTAVGFGFILLMKKIAPYLEIRFPAVAFILYVVSMLAIPAVVSCLCLKSQNKMSLVERIKSTE